MTLRIGALFLTPQAFLLPFAWAFFVLATRRQLRDRFPESGTTAYWVLATLAGAAGAVGYARLVEHLSGISGPTPWLHFGSLGGYAGALAGMAIAARMKRHSALAACDCAAPGIMQGAVVARIGCLFTGCCGEWAHGLYLPFPWAGLDLFICILTLGALARSRPSPGNATARLLVVYGLLRLAAEFLRAQPGIVGPFTAAQLACFVMICTGGIIWRQTLQPDTPIADSVSSNPLSADKPLLRSIAGYLASLFIAFLTLIACVLLTRPFATDDNGLDPGVDVCQNLTPEQFEAFRWKGNEDGLFHIKSSNSVLVYEMRPATRLNDYISTNADGFRDRPFSRTKDKDVRRIAVVGDSIGFGWWEKREETFAAQLEVLLNTYGRTARYEVYNFSIGGYNAEQEAELIETKVMEFKPDLILLQFCDNDNLTGCDSGLWWHFTKTGNPFKDYLLRRGIYFREIARNLAGNGILTRSYRRIARASKAVHIPVLLVPFPNRVPKNENPDVVALGFSAGFYVMDLRQELTPAERARFFIDDWHPNKEGHAIAARRICDYIMTHIWTDAPVSSATKE